MKGTRYVAIGLIFAAVLAIIVYSQTLDTTLSVNTNEKCSVSYYDEKEPFYDYVTRERNTYSTCYNAENLSYYQCINGTELYDRYEFIEVRNRLQTGCVF